jgi:hypothetical protein
MAGIFARGKAVKGRAKNEKRAAAEAAALSFKPTKVD